MGPGDGRRRGSDSDAPLSQPPRPCEAYRAEWELCRSAGHFLHHYYVHGERPACEQWRRDLASCREWEERRSAEAQSPVAAAEKELGWEFPAWTDQLAAAVEEAKDSCVEALTPCTSECHCIWRWDA
ncbi:UPF0545 protein C22orf39 homolog isoform X2 [Diceros bicornis minor]|uniref:UPF0545 protein C22orf39 homolog isoform X2 n=1 Tax=Diceros bicornis minor TaxID=77932 RepID=UPI0026F0F3EC|nr:UPF0545 protein C22orf39 homolog isoform X2 [Diceros bicornis minor]XP_058388132.1 UPF0545 protein C22orf39 homolog isoform X2 [Diceros bicornis minor]